MTKRTTDFAKSIDGSFGSEAMDKIGTISEKYNEHASGKADNERYQGEIADDAVQGSGETVMSFTVTVKSDGQNAESKSLSPEVVQEERIRKALERQEDQGAEKTSIDLSLNHEPER